MRGFLDWLYKAGGALGAVCLVALLVLICAQMVARWAGITFLGSDYYIGYTMASASFLAFAHALNSSSHIRVSLFLHALGKYRYWGELWAMTVATVLSCYVAWYAVKLVYISEKINDISQGGDATRLWIVQIPMAVGACLLAICFIDNLVSLIFYRRDNIRAENLESPEV